MRVKPEASVKEQFDAVFDVIETILKECESSLEKVVNCRIYIADLNDWPEINRLYSERFKSARPARVVVPVKELHFVLFFSSDVRSVKTVFNGFP